MSKLHGPDGPRRHDRAGCHAGGRQLCYPLPDYVNLSAKFGYHYANLDAFDGDDPDNNYIHLQFAGGVGTYAGKSLRLAFLGEVLVRLGFNLKVTGDLLEASVSGLDKSAMDQNLDQVGRLLASSRLLDMAISSEADIQPMVSAFFQGDYDFLTSPKAGACQIFIPPRATGGAKKRPAKVSCGRTAPTISAVFPPVWPV